LKAGTRLKSQKGSTQVVVVRPPAGEVELTCGGAPLVPVDAAGEPGAADSDGEPILLGKRYIDDGTGIELLCVTAGPGPLACDGRVMLAKGAKPLPSSD
jgi:hypothetical protein